MWPLPSRQTRYSTAAASLTSSRLAASHDRFRTAAAADIAPSRSLDLEGARHCICGEMQLHCLPCNRQPICSTLQWGEETVHVDSCVRVQVDSRATEATMKTNPRKCTRRGMPSLRRMRRTDCGSHDRLARAAAAPACALWLPALSRRRSAGTMLLLLTASLPLACSRTDWTHCFGLVNPVMTLHDNRPRWHSE